MALPATVAVKISSEAAGAISLTRVVARQLSLKELIDATLAVCGMDVERIQQTLQRGTLISGASRFRWEGFAAPLPELEALLSGYPRSESERTFDIERCTRVLFRGRGVSELAKEAGRKRRLFCRRSFWDEFAAIAVTANPAYIEYSYAERADRYRLAVTPDLRPAWTRAVSLLPYDVLRVQALAANHVDLLTYR